MSSFDFSKIGDFTVEIDPRRVDEERLLFYHECGVNRLSFGVQDFDLAVQKRINRIQPPELFDKLLTKKVRDKYKVFNFDLLVGLPGQTNESIQKTLDKVVEIKPTQIQPMLMHYDPFKRKYMIKMLKVIRIVTILKIYLKKMMKKKLKLMNLYLNKKMKKMKKK